MSLHDIFRGDVMPLSGVSISIGRNSFDPPAPVVPCFDIHARELNLYDSGDSISGIVSFNAERNHLIVNPSTSGAAAICTAVYYHAYNSSSQTLGSLTTPLTVDIDTVGAINSSRNFHTSSTGLTVWASGTYEITVRASTNSTDSLRRSARHWLEHSSGGGAFAEVPGSRHWTYIRFSANGEDTSLCTIILQGVAPGDKFRIRSANNTTTSFPLLSTIANGYGLTFIKVE